MALVTDRTESDALLGNEKGLYSYTDLTVWKRQFRK